VKLIDAELLQLAIDNLVEA